MLTVFGRLHPLLLHLPIGLLVGVAAVEALAWIRKKPAPPMPLLVWLAAASAVLAATTGFVLGLDGESVTQDRHQYFGIAVAVSTLLAAALQKRPRLYRAALLLSVALLFPTGHLGATLTHGENFLLRDLTEPADAPEVFAARCVSCHGPDKQKGDLRLDVADTAMGPEIVRRLRLPLDDEDHMPPEGKPQPLEAEILLVEAWAAVRRADEGAIARLRDAFVHIEEGPTGLRVDASAVAASFGDAEAAMLEPLRDHIEELSLARTKITDATMALVARMPKLRRLDARATAVSDVSALRGHPAIEELVLAQTAVASIEPLEAMPKLKRVYLWKTAVPPEAIAKLRERITVDAGDTPDSAALETEGDLKLTGDAPPPKGSLAPVNATCPVSGRPVAAEFQIVHKGRVVGFC